MKELFIHSQKSSCYCFQSNRSFRWYRQQHLKSAFLTWSADRQQHHDHTRRWCCLDLLVRFLGCFDRRFIRMVCHVYYGFQWKGKKFGEFRMIFLSNNLFSFTTNIIKWFDELYVKRLYTNFTQWMSVPYSFTALWWRVSLLMACLLSTLHFLDWKYAPAILYLDSCLRSTSEASRRVG